jgi:tetratricopeptide (TPR) repeat protein
MSDKINKASDENLRTALRKMEHLKNKLSLSDSVVEKAFYLYRKSLETGIVRGRFISTLITTTIYAACVDNFVSRNLKDIANASNETEYDIMRYYKTLTDHTNLDKIHTDAIEQYDKTLEINPDESRFLYDKAIECSNSEKYRDCISYCDKIIERYPTDTGTWKLKSYAYEDLNNFEQVIACCDAIIEIDPKNKNAWHDKGRAYDSLNNHERAIECYDKATEINSNNQNA